MSRTRAPAVPQRVNGYWYLVRRVPTEFAKLDRRRQVMLSSRIRCSDDPRCVQARRVVEQLDGELHAYWNDLKAGRKPEALKRYEWALETTRRFGLDYVKESDLLQSQLLEIVKRVEMLTPLGDEERKELRPALLGEVEPPKAGLKVAEMLTSFEGAVAASLLKKSPGQLRRWRKTRETALKVFVKLVGKHKLMRELTEDDAFNLRDYWNKRVLAGEVEIDTANKQIGYVAAMFREINVFERLKLADIFHRKIIKGAEKRQRAAFSVGHVQDVLLAAGAMDALNDEARAILYVVAELGLRPSEVCGLEERHIHLDEAIPFIEINEDGRKLKNRNSIRTVPLVGAALEAMKHFPGGFPRYRDKNDVLSATVNKHLVSNELLEREGQSFYSLRHTFKDRLRRAGVGDELMNKLMGHATGVEPYGDGYELKRKQEVLLGIAFRAPPVSFGQQSVPPLHERRPHDVRQRLAQGRGKLNRKQQGRPKARQPSAALAQAVQD